MTLTDINYSGEVYKSYASLTEANRILAVDTTRFSAWDPLDDAAKNRFLIAATERLDLETWQGEKTGGAAQHNAFPRTGLTYEDGTDIPDNVIPDDLARATALLAGTLAVTPSAASVGSQSARNVSRVKAGPVEVQFEESEGDRSAPDDPIADGAVHKLIRRWLGSRLAPTPGLVTGLTNKSPFGTRYDRLRGLA